MYDELQALMVLIEEARSLLEDIEKSNTQNFDSADVSNEDNIAQAFAGLDAFEGHVYDIVP